MRQPGTDLLAVACIVGGGVIAGGVTLALASDSELPSAECATTVGSEADVVMSLGGSGLVVVTPDVRLHEVKECMQASEMQGAEAHRVRVELTQAVELEARDMERAGREIERARREAERVRREVDRVRERVRRVDVSRVEVDRERAQEAMERARERVERSRERVERAAARRHEGREIDAEWIEQVTREALEQARVETMRLDELEFDGSLRDGLRIDLPEQTFEFRFEGLDGLEVEGLEDALRIQLEVLEGMELDFAGLDEELGEEIQQRIEDRMRELEERLKRIGENGGR